MDTEDVLAPVPQLFPTREAREVLDDHLTRALAAADERVMRGGVMPDLDMERFRTELASYDFVQPRALDALIDRTIGWLEHGTVHMAHPRYFGLFNPAANFPSQCADRISGAFNPQLASSGSSPAPVEIEAHVIRALARRAGLPSESAGHFTTNGSEANLTAFICALTWADPGFASHGVRAFTGPVAMYTSSECQPAWHKIAHACGVGREALRLIATDGSGRMDAEALRERILDDKRHGVVPVLISATAGTTGAGMVDPLERCAEVCREHRIWYHVDAAWGGAALCSERLRGELAGIEHADSVTIDAHKWFSTTMGCGMFITREPSVLSEAFQVGAEFMPSSAQRVDPYLNSIQWSRRFMGLRLFLSLAAAGWDGYAQHIERAVALIDHAKTLLTARGWSTLNASRLAVLCVVPPPGAPPIREIVRTVLASGRAWVAVAMFERREVIRICATHGETSFADVEELVRILDVARIT